MRLQIPIKEKWAKIQLWKQHPEWKTKDAVENLHVKKPTLLLWKKKYWNMENPPAEVGERFRRPGGGRRYKMAKCEYDVLEYHDRCLREDGKVSPADIMSYCLTKPEFSKLDSSTQRTRVRRFMDRFGQQQARVPHASTNPVQRVEYVDGVAPGVAPGVENVAPGVENVEIMAPGLENVALNDEYLDALMNEPPDMDSGELDVAQDAQVVPHDIGKGAQDEAQDVQDVPQDAQDVTQDAQDVDQDAQDVDQDAQDVAQDPQDPRSRSPLTLLSLTKFFEQVPTYEAAILLKSFRMFNIFKVPNVLALQLEKVPPSEVTPPEKLTRILPWSVIRRCEQRVSGLQHRKTGLREKDVVLKIDGVGSFATSTIATMKRWHIAIRAVNTIESAIEWLSTIDFTLEVSPEFVVARESSLEPRLKSIPIFSSEMDFLDLSAKGSLGDHVMNTLLDKLFCRRGVAVIKPTTLSVVIDGVISIDTKNLHSLFVGMTNETVLIPINCNGVHWSAIIVKLSSAEVIIYDPMCSSFLENVRDVAKTILPLLPPPTKRRYRMSSFEAELGIQPIATIVAYLF